MIGRLWHVHAPGEVGGNSKARRRAGHPRCAAVPGPAHKWYVGHRGCGLAEHTQGITQPAPSAPQQALPVPAQHATTQTHPAAGPLPSPSGSIPPPPLHLHWRRPPPPALPAPAPGPGPPRSGCSPGPGAHPRAGRGEWGCFCFVCFGGEGSGGGEAGGKGGGNEMSAVVVVGVVQVGGGRATGVGSGSGVVADGAGSAICCWSSQAASSTELHTVQLAAGSMCCTPAAAWRRVSHQPKQGSPTNHIGSVTPPSRSLCPPPETAHRHAAGDEHEAAHHLARPQPLEPRHPLPQVVLVGGWEQAAAGSGGGQSVATISQRQVVGASRKAVAVTVAVGTPGSGLEVPCTPASLMPIMYHAADPVCPTAAGAHAPHTNYMMAAATWLPHKTAVPGCPNAPHEHSSCPPMTNLLGLRDTAAALPAREAASGTTTSCPVNTTRSPGLARSVTLLRTTTSMVRGRLPPGIWGAGGGR